MTPEHVDLPRIVDRLNGPGAGIAAGRRTGQGPAPPRPAPHRSAVPRPGHRPAPIVAEVAYFLQIEPGPAVEAAFLDAVARSELVVEATTAQDFARMADLVRHCADFPLGTADAPVVAVAERLGATGPRLAQKPSTNGQPTARAGTQKPVALFGDILELVKDVPTIKDELHQVHEEVDELKRHMKVVKSAITDLSKVQHDLDRRVTRLEPAQTMRSS
jgi:hypothetical protein